MADMSGMGGGMTAGLGGVVGAVDQALTSLDPQAGAAAIGQVLPLLSGAPGLSGLASTLGELQSSLQGGAPDGGKVGGLLGTLARQTREASGQAGGLAGPLEQLAARLETAGRRVGGGG